MMTTQEAAAVDLACLKKSCIFFWGSWGESCGIFTHAWETWLTWSRHHSVSQPDGRTVVELPSTAAWWGTTTTRLAIFTPPSTTGNPLRWQTAPMIMASAEESAICCSSSSTTIFRTWEHTTITGHSRQLVYCYRTCSTAPRLSGPTNYGAGGQMLTRLCFLKFASYLICCLCRRRL